MFNDYYGYWELSKEDRGNIICTGFLNKKMPLIRYELDDSAEKYFDRYKITGHRDGFLYGLHGEIISAAALEVHSKILEKISNYQFHQKEKGKVDVLYMPFSQLSKEDESALKDIFQTKVGEVIIVNVREVNEMILTNRAKFRLIIQEVK